jgi:hypothetical protein
MQWCAWDLDCRPVEGQSARRPLSSCAQTSATFMFRLQAFIAAVIGGLDRYMATLPAS